MAVLVIFKNNWFAPNGERFRVLGRPVEVADDLVPFLPKTAKIATVADVCERNPDGTPAWKDEPVTLSQLEADRAAGDALDALIAKADATDAANRERRKRK